MQPKAFIPLHENKSETRSLLDSKFQHSDADSTELLIPYYSASSKTLSIVLNFNI